jgi:hypothetical protein
MSTPNPAPDFLLAPNGSRVRIAAGGAVFSDLGPAMGRTTSFPHRILANVPNFRDLVVRRMVGNREGYILSAEGMYRLLVILAENVSKTPENQSALDTFRDWATQTLIPELVARFGAAQPCPGKIRICAGGVDLRLDLADLGLLLVEIERPGQPKATLQGTALLQATQA